MLSRHELISLAVGEFLQDGLLSVDTMVALDAQGIVIEDVLNGAASTIEIGHSQSNDLLH